ncbi:MAG TPA: hypothetical protein VNE39_13680 [Planctomycetota bacterium]|nr:hypothetical protein [Planctomycetota bacterium]
MPAVLKELPDTRFEPFIEYDKRFLFWWGILLFVLELGSRRQLDSDLRDDETEVLGNVNRLARTEQTTLPVHGTLEHFVGHVGSAFYGALRTRMLERPIRMKALDGARLRGRFVVALDGTGWLCLTERHCPHCLEQKQNGKTIYLHQVLEAKLVSPSGLALSMASEFIENPAGNPGTAAKSEEERKQDCELKAFARLAPELRKAYPQLSLCLTSDSLYGCGPALQTAKDHRLSYVFVFKPGRTPALWADFQGLLALAPENTRTVEEPDKTLCVYRWINGLVHEDTQGRTHRLNALQCTVTRDGKTTLFAWMTDLPLNDRTVQDIATKGGRIRAKIENQGFNAQKNSGLNLEHAYSHDLEIAKAYYYMIQIAHTLLQFLVLGSLLARLARDYGKTPVALYGGLKNIPRRLLDCFRYFALPDEAFRPHLAIRVRLDTS